MTKRNIAIIISLALFTLIAGAFVYDAVLGETEEASEPISAVPLELDTNREETADPVSEQPAASEGTGTDTQTDPEAETELAAEPETESAAESQGGTTGGLTVYSISQDESLASFSLPEVLRGSPTTVLGTTDQVAGEIAIDLSDLSTAQVGTIQVNARTLETDESRRDQAIRNRILDTDSYEFITFVPTNIVGLSGSASPGQSLTFQIEGDLTIRDITQPVTFEVTAEIDENGRLTGEAQTIVTRAQFDLSIPSVPFVADVGEDVSITLNFIAPAN